MSGLPVPPVVPDSDGEVQPLDLSDDERAGLLTALDELHGPSGSGVVPDKPAPLCTCSAIPMRGHLRGCPLSVPDKPALAPDEDCPLCFGSGTVHCGLSVCRGGQCGRPCNCPYRTASVPAVTDDEAATKVIVHHTKET